MGGESGLHGALATIQGKKKPNSSGSSQVSSAPLGFHPLIQISILDKAAQELLDYEMAATQQDAQSHGLKSPQP